jgi:FKBP-type peptidyl-prolyl cis-trans isomerase 2
MKIEEGKRVRVQVMLKVVDGDVIEQSGVEFIQGGNTMLAGVERILEGCEPGDERKGVLKAEEAFGREEDLPTKMLGRDSFPEDAKLEVGEIFAAKSAEGQDVNFRIVEVKDDEVEVRFLHPLVGKDIEYDLKVISVTDPAPPPLPSDALAEELEEDGQDNEKKQAEEKKEEKEENA